MESRKHLYFGILGLMATCTNLILQGVWLNPLFILKLMIIRPYLFVLISIIWYTLVEIFISMPIFKDW